MSPSLVVIHYTAISCAEARARLCDPAAEVSAHWLISEQGAVEALVDERHRAWHAGAGSWGGLDDINSHSIGIELANDGSQPFAEPQMAALESLLAAILARWSIPPHRVIGHSDMAPQRKSDPGGISIGGVWRAKGFRSGRISAIPPPPLPPASRALATPMRPPISALPPSACAFALGPAARKTPPTAPWPITSPKTSRPPDPPKGRQFHLGPNTPAGGTFGRAGALSWQGHPHRPPPP